MSHAQRHPEKLSRVLAYGAQRYYPTRESDGPAYVGTMVDARQERIATARENAVRYISAARSDRLAGNCKHWAWCMAQGAVWRQRFIGLLRSGGRVNWRGEPSELQQ